MATNIDKAQVLARILADAGAEPLTDSEKSRQVASGLFENATVKSEPEPVTEEADEIPDDSTTENDGDGVDDKSTETEEVVEAEISTDAVEKPVGKSKEVKKIIDLKSENKTLRKELAELREAKRKAELVSQYGEKYDEDVATEKAESQIIREKYERRMELLEFKADNATILGKYPDARADADHIYEMVQSSGMTVEQVCRGLYGNTEPLDIRRAKAKANGELPTSDSNTVNVTKAVNSSVRKSETNTLTADERNIMDRMNSKIPDGAPHVTVEEMIARRKRI